MNLVLCQFFDHALNLYQVSWKYIEQSQSYGPNWKIQRGIIPQNCRWSIGSYSLHTIWYCFIFVQRLWKFLWQFKVLELTQFSYYRKNSKNWDTLNYYRDCPTNGIVGFHSAILHSKDADRITNRVDTDQTAAWGAVWSGSALFAHTYLSQYLKLLR